MLQIPTFFTPYILEQCEKYFFILLILNVSLLQRELLTVYNHLIPALIAVFVFSFSAANAMGKFDVDFYNVGQGHCIIARSVKMGS